MYQLFTLHIWHLGPSVSPPQGWILSLYYIRKKTVFVLLKMSMRSDLAGSCWLQSHQWSDFHQKLRVNYDFLSNTLNSFLALNIKSSTRISQVDMVTGQYRCCSSSAVLITNYFYREVTGNLAALKLESSLIALKTVFTLDVLCLLDPRFKRSVEIFDWSWLQPPWMQRYISQIWFKMKWP